MLGQCRLDSRDEIAAIRLVIRMLQLASAAFGKVTAWRHLMVRSERQRPIVEQGVSRDSPRHMAAALRYPVSTRGDADDQFVHPRSASAPGIAAARSSAIM